MTAGRTHPRLRPVGPEDEPFLRTLFTQGRGPEFAALDLGDEALGNLLAMQYTAQDRSYRALHPEAAFDIVELDCAPIGRLSVDRTGNAIRVIDIALMPEHRGRGIGTRLLRALIAEATESDRAIRLAVVRTNPALALYRRLGFVGAGGDEVHLELERPPAPVS